MVTEQIANLSTLTGRTGSTPVLSANLILVRYYMYYIDDIASFATALGFEYNQTISLMENDRFVPFYETKCKYIYIGYGSDYSLSKDLSDIIDKFVVVHGECEIVQ